MEQKASLYLKTRIQTTPKLKALWSHLGFKDIFLILLQWWKPNPGHDHKGSRVRDANPGVVVIWFPSLWAGLSGRSLHPPARPPAVHLPTPLHLSISLPFTFMVMCTHGVCVLCGSLRSKLRAVLRFCLSQFLRLDLLPIRYSLLVSEP